MDMHSRVMAILHIACGILLIGAILIAGLFFSALFSVAQESPGAFAGLGAAVAIPFIVIGACQMGAAVAYLNGKAAARPFVIVFGVLGMLSFPLGTALGLYTIWVLLVRKQPAAPQH